MDVEKLIEHLERRGLSNGSSLGPHSGLYDEAADAFTALLAENKRLRAELERVKVERDAYQAYFKDLSSKPDCNTCEKRSCEYKPRPGAIVRVNCPLYSGPEKED